LLPIDPYEGYLFNVEEYHEFMDQSKSICNYREKILHKMPSIGTAWNDIDDPAIQPII
jgi:hypothetical protein